MAMMTVTQGLSATSPHTVPLVGPGKYFRLRMP